ncbi:hypothetical protein DRE_04072 [Drechslerella stenobrocha 248]|uniref:C3H1-type domain-containing protein n=1 Tax=Drechslerella stenobrocha 248 TaxID=1043628 RepID=W7IBY2_9PEZI|nr:hypothetical protein DRE_04072 [Drechslerella stenobrocha 248]
MSPVSFQSSNAVAARGQPSSRQNGDGVSLSQVDTAIPKPPAKTSRFTSLFSRAGTTTDASAPKSAEDDKTALNGIDIPRYKAPKNGQGTRAPPTPPQATELSEPNARRLYLDNVPYCAKKQDILAFFKGFKVELVDIPKKSDSQKKGVAFVSLTSEVEAKRAVTQLHNTAMKGRRIRVMPTKINNHHRRQQPDKAKVTGHIEALQASVTKDRPADIQRALNVGPVYRTMAGNVSSLRKGMFNLACQAITAEKKTPDEIFCEMNFNQEEKMMIRDFYFQHKQTQKEKNNSLGLVNLLKNLEQQCAVHGLVQCMDCHQALLLQQIYMEEQKENLRTNKPSHQHTPSWDSCMTLQGQSSPEYPSGKAGTMVLTRPGAIRSTIVPANLDAAGALRLYGPKYFKENYPQEEPPIHNSYGPRGKYIQDDPFHRQQSVVSTQPGVKTHCAFYLRTGHCDFAQQGCKFSHELPPGGHVELATHIRRRAVARNNGQSNNGQSSNGQSSNGQSSNGQSSNGHSSNAGRNGQNSNIGRSGVTANISGPTNKRQPIVKPSVGKPRGGIKISENPFLALATDNKAEPDSQESSPRAATVPDPSIKVDYSINGARQRLTSQLCYKQRAPSSLWRDVACWRDKMPSIGRPATETDGAADDEDEEGTSSDLISLSSSGFNNYT